jgi:pimeloyl-ACP methyl ester carboxylesterase
MSTSVPARHGFLDADGLRLHYVEFGGTGRPILCLHGVCGHAWMWHDVAGSLSDLGRVVSVDMRGHGDSQWSPDGDYTTEHHAEDLERLIETLDAPEVDLVGLSWGGLAALSYTARHPEGVRRLAIIDVPPSFAQSETDLLPRPYVFGSQAEAFEWERNANPHASDDMIRILSFFGTRPAEGGLARKHDPYFLERWPFRSDDHWAELGSVEVPLLLVHAEQSYVLAADVAERMAGVLRNGRLVRVPDSGHHVPVENPAALARALGEFLS